MKLILQLQNSIGSISIAPLGDTRVFTEVGINASSFPNDYLQDIEAGTPGLFRAPLPGKYRFSGVLTADSADAGQVRLSIQRESGAAKIGSVGHASLLSPVVLELAAGEVVGFRGYNPSPDTAVVLQDGGDYNYGLIEFLD